MFPSTSLFSSPFAILNACEITFFDKKLSFLKEDSWLKKIPALQKSFFSILKYLVA